jgi:hypothetical protein
MNDFIKFLIAAIFNERGEVGGDGGAPAGGDGGAAATLLGGDGGEPAPAGTSTPVVDPDNTIANGPQLISEGWMKGAESDYANDPVMKAVPDVGTLVKNYVHAQRQMGKKGFILPTKDSEGAQWRELYTALGGPGKDEYKYDMPENHGLMEDFVNAFNGVAHENNILPGQAKAVMDFYLQQVAEQEQAMANDSQQAIQESMQALQQEWGEGFEKKVGQAQQVVSTFGDEDLRAYLDSSGLGNDPKLIKLLANVGDSLNEDTFQKDALPNMGVTPQEAKDEIDKTMSDFGHPYHNSKHLEHQKAVSRMAKLFEIVSA